MRRRELADARRLAEDADALRLNRSFQYVLGQLTDRAGIPKLGKPRIFPVQVLDPQTYYGIVKVPTSGPSQPGRHLVPDQDYLDHCQREADAR